MSDLAPLPTVPVSSDVEDDDARIRRIIARDYAYTPRVMQYVIDTGASSSFINDARFFDSLREQE